MSSTTPNFSLTLPAVADPIDQDLWGTELNSNFTSIDTLLLRLVPVGTILPYAASSAPTGYLLCYGQAVSRATYATLFALVSTTYGTGDGSTTFNLPDLRGRVPLTLDNLGGSAASRVASATSLNANGGLETTTATGSISGSVGTSGATTLSTSQIPALTYNVKSSPDNAGTQYLYAGDAAATTHNVSGATASNAGGGAHTHSGGTLSASFTGSAVESMPPWIGLSAIIKY